ncbi:MAG: ABC transporter substrate-binding protein, partial [Hyphomicrobiales bacterium]|nr:ABC transporter substrate-binding protein [Hyphomicrobiales bacterium]
MTDKITRRGALGAAAGLAAFAAGGAKASAAPAALNIVDVGGAFALVKPALESFVAAHPELVSHVAYNQAPSPELPGKLKAQMDAGRLDIDFV